MASIQSSVVLTSSDAVYIHHQTAVQSRLRKLVKERRGSLPSTMSADLKLAAARASVLVASFKKKVN